jgi:protein SCO1/2
VGSHHDDPTAASLSRRQALAMIVTGVAMGALGGCGLQSSGTRLADADADAGSGGWAGDRLDPPVELPDVTFTDVDGNPYPFRGKAAGRLTLLSFGYTTCADVCPVFLNALARAVERLDGGEPLVAFVGVDLARDTPDQLRRYVAGLPGSFVGLTGTAEVIDTANRLVGNRPITIGAPDGDGDYDVDHDARILAFTPDGLAHRVYERSVHQAAWAQDLARLAQGRYR